MATDASRRIARIGLSVADLETARAFYCDGLGFQLAGRETRSGAAFEALTGLAGARAEIAVLRLGEQEIELAAFAPAGAPYPQPRAANDPWFQHFAIAVGDMEAADAQARAHGAAAISRGGPQRLPPSTGSVTADKLRDPQGHPLELSLIPQSAWRGMAGLFLGIDHTALAVADLAASRDFYTRLLGFQVAGQGLNQGPEQDALDGLDGVRLDILVLETGGGGPHVELLHYRSPRSAAAPRRLAVNDVGATRTMIECGDLAALVERLRGARCDFVSAGLVEQDARPRALLRDPDGHLLELVAAG